MSKISTFYILKGFKRKLEFTGIFSKNNHLRLYCKPLKQWNKPIISFSFYRYATAIWKIIDYSANMTNHPWTWQQVHWHDCILIQFGNEACNKDKSNRWRWCLSWASTDATLLSFMAFPSFLLPSWVSGFQPRVKKMHQVWFELITYHCLFWSKSNLNWCSLCSHKAQCV